MLASCTLILVNAACCAAGNHFLVRWIHVQCTTGTTGNRVVMLKTHRPESSLSMARCADLQLRAVSEQAVSESQVTLGLE